MTLPLVLAIAGCIALLVGVFGGGVKAKEVEIPKISLWPRIFSGLIGAALIGISTLLAFPPSPSEPPPENELAPTPLVREFTVYADESWQDTGIPVGLGSRVVVDYVSGSWTLDKDHPQSYSRVSASGYMPDPPAWGHLTKLLPSAPFGALIGRIGSGNIIEVGQGVEFMSERSGNLQLTVNDDQDWLEDNEGSIRVRISIYP